MRHNITGKQHNSKQCFICGLKNSSGLKASFFETEGNELIAKFTPHEDHQSYPGRLHGGIASAILDETIGRAISIGAAEQIWGITVELSVQFKKPVRKQKQPGHIFSPYNRNVRAVPILINFRESEIGTVLVTF